MLESLANTCQKINFRIEQIFYDEKEIAKFIFDLDKCISPKSVSLNYYRNPKTQIQFVVFAGGLPLGSSSQITAEGNLRIIYPQFSKHASINIGIHFSNTVQGNNQPYFGTVYNKQYEIFSVPVTFQGSFSIGIVHPYVYLGLSASDIKEKSNNAEYASYLGLQNKFTVDALCGIGIEVHITKQLFAKVDWRYELVVQYPAVGIAFKF
jgi:hypothetical protein